MLAGNDNFGLQVSSRAAGSFNGAPDNDSIGMSLSFDQIKAHINQSRADHSYMIALVARNLINQIYYSSPLGAGIAGKLSASMASRVNLRSKLT